MSIGKFRTLRTSQMYKPYLQENDAWLLIMCLYRGLLASDVAVKELFNVFEAASSDQAEVVLMKDFNLPVVICKHETAKKGSIKNVLWTRRIVNS